MDGQDLRSQPNPNNLAAVASAVETIPSGGPRAAFLAKANLTVNPKELSKAQMKNP